MKRGRLLKCWKCAVAWQDELSAAGMFLIVLAFFLRFAGASLFGGLNNDDPMNIHSAWYRGWWELAKNLVMFFTTYGRPMGGVYFGILYDLFGLNPLPYHAVLIGLLLINVHLSYQFGRVIGGSRATGGLTAMIVAYHGALVHLVYLPAYVFDVLCFTFYLLGLNYYVRTRESGKPFGWKQTLLLLVLYAGALDSKEMAVTFPAMLLLYDILSGSRDWFSTPVMMTTAMTGVYILGKTMGADALIRMEAYRPEFSWARYWESTTRFVNTILTERLSGGPLHPSGVALFAFVLLYVAWRSRQRHVLWLWCFVWIAALPITFIPGRGGACLYLPLVGWAALGASLFVRLARAAAESRVLRWMPRRVAVGALVFIGMAAYWRETQRRAGDIPEVVLKPARAMWEVADEVRRVQPRVRPGSTAYLVRGPLPGFDMKFVMELVWHDRSVNLWVGEQAPLPPEEVARMDYVFTFEGGRLQRLKSPDAERCGRVGVD